jgi:ABC-type microcin C transport system permease subunit YejE
VCGDGKQGKGRGPPPHTPPPLPLVALTVATLAAAVAAAPCASAAPPFQRAFSALWPARVALALYAALFLAAQPLALDTPARALLPPSAAAWAAGSSTPRILVSEVLPNIMTHLAVVGTLEMALAILLEAALSFLGLGVPPPLPSWGLMIAEGRDFMFFSAWVIWIPGIALFTLVLAINLLGDGLRDLFGAAPS